MRCFHNRRFHSRYGRKRCWLGCGSRAAAPPNGAVVCNVAGFHRGSEWMVLPCRVDRSALRSSNSQGATHCHKEPAESFALAESGPSGWKRGRSRSAASHRSPKLLWRHGHWPLRLRGSLPMGKMFLNWASLPILHNGSCLKPSALACSWPSGYCSGPRQSGHRAGSPRVLALPAAQRTAAQQRDCRRSVPPRRGWWRDSPPGRWPTDSPAWGSRADSRS